jgi:hypothetical protein
MIPLQPFMNQFGVGYHTSKQGHCVYQNPSWPAISQNQSFLETWSQMSQPVIVIHVGSTSPFTASHTGIISPTSSSQDGDRLTTSASHVEYLQPTTTCHGGSTSPVTMIHIGITSPTSASHVGDMLLASAIHARRMSPATASHVGGIHMIEKPICIGRKPKFFYRLCKGDHLTHMCPATTMVQEAWSLHGDPSGFESSLVLQHSNPSLVDTMVMSMKYSANTTLILGGDLSLDHVVSHHVQPAVVSMQSSTDTTPIFWGDASLDHVVSHHIQPMVEKVVMSMQSLVDPTLLLESDKSK